MKTLRIFIVMFVAFLTVLTGCAQKGSGSASEPTGSDPRQSASPAPETMGPSASANPTMDSTPSPSDNYEAEQKVYDLFNKDEKSAADIKVLLTALPDMNWTKYSRYCSSVGAEAYDLMDWLYNLDITDEADIIHIMKSTQGLDGAYAEGFCGVLANILSAHTELFVRCLAQTDDEDIPLLCGYAAYYLGYGGLEEQRAMIIADINTLLDGSTLGDREQQAATQLRDALSDPEAC